MKKTLVEQIQEKLSAEDYEKIRTLTERLHSLVGEAYIEGFETVQSDEVIYEEELDRELTAEEHFHPNSRVYHILQGTFDD